ncbi:bifunctional hydroxymethylpyrimidine kinase/phosphomethylpyrimidine kinase [Deferrisoma palaeochoriense]
MREVQATPPRCLTVAGSDSGGGAGIQADLRTFALLGCHGSSALTAVTAQNSVGVHGVYPLEPGAVGAQIDAVLSDIGADAVKTGMLHSAPIIEAVAEALGRHGVERLVVDPVMVAKGGAPLLRDDARDALVGRLLPRALLVTPNLPEAEALGGRPIRSAEDREAAARRVIEAGARAVLVKGGHAEGAEVEDLLLLADGGTHRFRSPRVPTPHTHGTGCTLSAAIAAFLARGDGLVDAVRRARAVLVEAVANAYPLGAGHGPTNPWAGSPLVARHGVLERLWAAWEILEEANPVELIPEVQSNLAEALPAAATFDDVAAFPGRIVRAGDRVRRVDGPRFGASRHMAKILLASARWGSPFRAVMNVRYGEDVLDACRALGLRVEGFSRAEEPREVKEREGSTLEWGTAEVLRRAARAPDAIYDTGDQGKEPMIRIFGATAPEVARRVAAVAREMRRVAP